MFNEDVSFILNFLRQVKSQKISITILYIPGTLENELKNETFSRVTCSFYRYILIEKPELVRDQLYRDWSDLKIFGRIYIASEGINAQLSCPENNWNLFVDTIRSRDILNNIPIKKAIQDGASFYKLTIKVKEEIVKYNVDKGDYDSMLLNKEL